MTDNQYKIELGVKLNTKDISTQIGKAEGQIDPIKIRVDAETKELTNTIKEALNSLSKGTKNALTLDTSKIEASLKDVADEIRIIKSSIGTLDGGDMKSLLTTINQINVALDKASNQFVELNRSLDALNRKDFSLDIGIKLGGSNSVTNNSLYGDFVKDDVLPTLKKQEQALTKYLAQYFHTNEFSAVDKLLSKSGNGLGGVGGVIEIMDRLESPLKKGESLKDRMRDYKNFINSIMSSANMQGIDLSPVLSQFEKLPNELIETADNIRNGTKQVDDSIDKLKHVFGGSGIDAESLSASLEPITKDLTEIREAVVNLSKGVSLEGLTSSFDRLSDTIEKLVSNVTLAKAALGDGLGSIASANINPITNVEKTSEATTTTVIQNEKKKQEAYKATADAVIYHAGVVSRLNKAETNGRFYGSDRGTGYYGTGHYFVDAATKGELDRSSYSKLPYTSVDISKYDNLFRASTDEIAGKLHDFLKNLTRFTQGSDSYDVSELFTQFKSVFGDTIMDIKEFGSRLDQLKIFMSNSNLSDRSDSVSTQFMKSLGYEGVDTRGTRYADTEYGTVIYDLKEESILQANITDELQKQGQMLEKINYAKGQVFDKDEDDRIQGIIDAQNKLQEIKNEFKNSFDSTGLDKAESDLSAAENRLREIDETIGSVQHSLNNLEQEYKEFSSLMSMVGLDDDDILLWEDEDEWKQNKAEDYQNYIKTLNQEKAELQSKIPILEEVYNREQQLANEAYEQSKRVVEQRHLEAQQAKETANIVAQSIDKQAQSMKQMSLDDVIDKQIMQLMNEYAITGSKAFNEIKQSLVDFRNGTGDINKVTSAISNNMKVINDAKDDYRELAEYIKMFNASGAKVHIPDSIRQEYGDDYKSMRSQLGKGFTSGKGMDFETFVEETNEILGQTIDLSHGAEAAFGDLVDKVNSTKGGKFLTGDDLFKNGILDMGDVVANVSTSLEQIEKAEEEIAKTSASVANTVVQNEEKKQRAYQETSNAYDRISKDTSLVRDDGKFKQVFEVSNQAAQEAQRHFQELLADEKAVVSVTEQFDDSKSLQSFAVNIKRATGEVETLRYAMKNLAFEGEEDDWIFAYRGASTNDSSVERQLEKRIKKANDLQIQLDKIKSGYSDVNATKSIKDTDHLESLNNQYDKVVKAIADVRNADNTTFASMISNAEKEKAALENMVREFRNAENVATSLRSKDIDTVKSTYDSKLDVLISKMRKDGVYTSGFEKGAENLRSVLSNSTDASGFVKFLNGLDKLEAGYKRASASVKEFNQSQKVGINVSGLESKIADIQRISPEINKFEAEIDGAKVSVQSLLSDLKQVKTQGDFSVVNSRFKAFADAAKAAGIAIAETAQKANSINDIKIKLELGTFENQVHQLHNQLDQLTDIDGSLNKLRTSIKQVDDAYDAMTTATDDESLIQAQKRFAAAVEKTNNELKIQTREQRAANNAAKLADSRAALKTDMLNWLKKNSKATKEYKSEIDRLIASLDKLDQAGVNGVRRQFNNIDRDAELKGLKGLNFFDSMKSKIKEYSVYFGAAEMFMYAEQGLRDMFEQVKLIDSAMTELKKVTNETDAAYDEFLTNAADRAKAIGTTIDGLVSSTADFARLGYGFKDAQGLAEVANIYAVVGDEIEGVEGATESLISTMAAFKDSANGMSNEDFAMSIVDKFNEIGKLIA